MLVIDLAFACKKIRHGYVAFPLIYLVLIQYGACPFYEQTLVQSHAAKAASIAISS